MEDDRNNLIANHETSVYSGFVAEPQRRSFFKGTACPAFSILMALLFAGQAATIYFVYQHNNQISKLTANTQQLKLQSLANSLPHNSKTGNGMKLTMANMMPLAMRDTESLEEEMKLTNTTQDQVKRLLLLENPSRKFPELKSNFRENMYQLRKRMPYEDWKSFETWMHKWLLFQLAQNEDPEEEVETKCQEEASVKGVKPGRFRPQCDENGDYLPKQCDYSTGFCWCVYKNGTMVEGTSKVRGPLDCTGDVGTLAPQTVAPTEVNLM